MRSKWSPLPEKFSALDHYIDKCCREIDQLNFKEKCNQYNLPQPELAALRNLRNRNDSVIRPTDKGGAFVVWEKELYLNEAHRQLSDGRFYQRIPEDATKRNQETVEAFIAQAIAKEGLLQSATNLIVQHPRTSKFYLLPKINKPGNPGRPIISACQCPIELLASYLDKVTAPFVRGLDSYVKDSGHMLTILDSFCFRGEHRFIFTMDIKYLYTVIPNDEGLRTIKCFLDKWEVLDPPTHTLLRMAELVLTLNSFVFNGEHYKQIGVVAMGSKLGPNYACLFVGYVEEKMLRNYTGITPDLYRRYMDDVAGAASCTEDDLTWFLTFASSYHPKLEYTWLTFSAKLAFLDMFLIPCDDRVACLILSSVKRQYQQANFYDCGKFAARKTTLKKQRPPWSLSLLRAVIPSN